MVVHPKVKAVESEETDDEEDAEDSDSSPALRIAGSSRRLAYDYRRPPASLVLVMSLVFVVEGIDTALLPAVAFAIQRDLQLKLVHFSFCSMAQAIAMAGMGPIWGILADRRVYRRKSLMAFGAVMQGVITMGLAFVDNLGAMVLLRFCNGAMLASLRPLSIGIVADSTSENYRGKVYGWLQFFNTVGMMLGTLAATPMSTETIFGQQGWRVAFVIAGFFAILTGIVITKVMKEVKREKTWDPEGKSRDGLTSCTEELGKLGSYFTMPTFVCLVLQGLFGSIPWNAFNYSTLFFQVGGLTSKAAASLNTIFQATCAVGNIIGGIIGDFLAGKCPYHGRAFAANMSVAAGIPCVMLIYLVMPPDWVPGGPYWWYFSLLAVMGLTATWCAAGVNWPILGQITDPHQRSTIMAWEGALEGATAAFLGNAAVGFLAENMFGYDLADADVDLNSKSAHALGLALSMTSLIPWLICFGCYLALHWALPFDLRRIEAAKNKYLDEHDGELLGDSSDESSDGF